MHPFFSVFGLVFPAYGVMMMLGIGSAFTLVAILCRPSAKNRRGLDRMDTILTCSIAILGMIIGGFALRPLMKLPEVIFRWGYFYQMPVGEFFGYIFGEFVFYGGLIGGAIASFIFCRGYKVPVLTTFDAISAAVPLGHAFGRVGCFLAGCCHGARVSRDSAFAVVYPATSLSAPSGVPLVAVPLIEAMALVLISAIIVVIFMKTKIAGLCFGLYIMLYSVVRFILEFFRGDPGRGVYGIFSTSQYISIALFVLSAVLICIIICRRSRDLTATQY